MFKDLIKLLKYVKNGNLSAIDSYQLITHLRRRQEVTVRPKLVDHPITIRGDGSDVDVFNQIFVQRAYDIEVTPEPRYIVDAGANIGASTLFFARKYPEAQIAAIEPSSSNMAMLKRNCGTLSNVRLFENGLYHHVAPLRIKNPDCGREWSLQVEQCDEAEAEFTGISMNHLMDTLHFPHIDLLKIDIEGAELEVFSQGYSEWINKVNVLIIELHDFCRSGCSQSVFRALGEMDPFSMNLLGENLVITRSDPLACSN